MLARGAGIGRALLALRGLLNLGRHIAHPSSVPPSQHSRRCAQHVREREKAREQRAAYEAFLLPALRRHADRERNRNEAAGALQRTNQLHLLEQRADGETLRLSIRRPRYENTLLAVDRAEVSARSHAVLEQLLVPGLLAAELKAEVTAGRAARYTFLYCDDRVRMRLAGRLQKPQYVRASARNA